MNRTDRRPTGAALVVGALIGALALTGCGAGQVTSTSSQVTATGGANVTRGAISVRDAQIEFDGPVEGGSAYPAGAGAPLRMAIVNGGTEADRLVSVTSPVASSVTVAGTTEVLGGLALVVAGEPVESAPADEPAEDTEPTPAVEPPAAGGEPTAQIVLAGLREPLRSGLTYPVVMTFERAGQVRIDLPLANPSEPREAEPAPE